MEAVPDPAPLPNLPSVVEVLQRERAAALQQLQRLRYENAQLRENEAMIIGALSGAALMGAVYLWLTLVVFAED